MKTPEHPIFIESVKYIRSIIGNTGLDEVQQSILERIIHSSGDFGLQSCLKFSPTACKDAIKALKNGATILTDTYMAEAAISPMAKRTLNSNIECILDMAPASISINTSLTTRSAIGMKNKWLNFEDKDAKKKPSALNSHYHSNVAPISTKLCLTAFQTICNTSYFVADFLGFQS